MTDVNCIPSKGFSPYPLTHWPVDNLCLWALSLSLYIYFFSRAARVTLVPRPGIEPMSRLWKHGVLTTGPPGNSQCALNINSTFQFQEHQSTRSRALFLWEKGIATPTLQVKKWRPKSGCQCLPVSYKVLCFVVSSLVSHRVSLLG